MYKEEDSNREVEKNASGKEEEELDREEKRRQQYQGTKWPSLICN